MKFLAFFSRRFAIASKQPKFAARPSFNSRATNTNREKNFGASKSPTSASPDLKSRKSAYGYKNSYSNSNSKNYDGPKRFMKSEMKGTQRSNNFGKQNRRDTENEKFSFQKNESDSGFWNLENELMKEHAKDPGNRGFLGPIKEDDEEIQDDVSQKIYKARMRDQGYYYSIKFKQLCRAKKYDQAYEFLMNGLRERKFPLEPAIFNQAIYEFGKAVRIHYAYSIYLAIRSRHVPADRHTYIALFNGYAETGNSPSLVNYEGNHIVYRKYMDKVFELYSSMKTNPLIPPSVDVFNCAMKACSVIGTMDDLKLLFPVNSEMDATYDGFFLDGIEPNTISYTLAVQCCIRNNRFPDCGKYIDDMLDKQIPFDIKLLNTILTGLRSHFRFLSKSKDETVQERYQKERQKFSETAINIFDFFVKDQADKSVKPDIISYSLVLDILRDLRQYELATIFYAARVEKVVEEIESKKQEIDFQFYNTLLSIFGSNKDRTRVYEIVNKLAEKRIGLNVGVVNHLLDFFTNVEDVEHVSAVMKVFFGYSSSSATSSDLPFSYVKPKRLYSPTPNTIYQYLRSIKENSEFSSFLRWLKCNHHDVYKESKDFKNLGVWYSTIESQKN